MNLTEWINHEYPTLDANLLYKRAAHHQLVFVNGIIASLFPLNGVQVVGEHAAKNCRLPVYQILDPKAGDSEAITFRGNFHDWTVVRSLPSHAMIGDRLTSILTKNGAPYGYEGMEGFSDAAPYAKQLDEIESVWDRMSYRCCSDYELYALLLTMSEW
jgi:hypothetical protein